MPPKLKRLSGKDVIAILHQFGFLIHSQRGSHVKLRCVSSSGEKQTLTIPTREEFDVGTLRAIMRQASRYIPEDQLKSHFYTE